MNPIWKNAARLALALVLVACSSGSTTTTAPVPAATTAAAPTPATTTVAATGEEIAVAATGLGDVLVDAKGRTLYSFVPDAQGASTCYDACADNWPAIVGPATSGDGADSSLLGTTTRTDGTVQATYNGWPIYYFAGDANPGDTNGQGIGEVWWVIDGAGNQISG